METIAFCPKIGLTASQFPENILQCSPQLGPSVLRLRGFFEIGISCDFERGIFTGSDTLVPAERKNPEEVLRTLIEQKPGTSVNKIIAASGLRRDTVTPAA